MSDLPSNYDCDLARRTIIASAVLFIANTAQLVPLIFEIYTLIGDLTVNHPKYYILSNLFMQVYIDVNMPEWILKFYEVSHFLAMLPPAVYSFIFYGEKFVFGVKENKNLNPCLTSMNFARMKLQMKQYSLNMILKRKRTASLQQLSHSQSHNISYFVFE